MGSLARCRMVPPSCNWDLPHVSSSATFRGLGIVAYAARHSVVVATVSEAGAAVVLPITVENSDQKKVTCVSLLPVASRLLLFAGDEGGAVRIYDATAFVGAEADGRSRGEGPVAAPGGRAAAPRAFHVARAASSHQPIVKAVHASVCGSPADNVCSLCVAELRGGLQFFRLRVAEEGAGEEHTVTPVHAVAPDESGGGGGIPTCVRLAAAAGQLLCVVGFHTGRVAVLRLSGGAKGAARGVLAFGMPHDDSVQGLQVWTEAGGEGGELLTVHVATCGRDQRVVVSRAAVSEGQGGGGGGGGGVVQKMEVVSRPFIPFGFQAKRDNPDAYQARCLSLQAAGSLLYVSTPLGDAVLRYDLGPLFAGELVAPVAAEGGGGGGGSEPKLPRIPFAYVTALPPQMTLPPSGSGVTHGAGRSRDKGRAAAPVYAMEVFAFEGGGGGGAVGGASCTVLLTLGRDRRVCVFTEAAGGVPVPGDGKSEGPRATLVDVLYCNGGAVHCGASSSTSAGGGHGGGWALEAAAGCSDSSLCLFVSGDGGGAPLVVRGLPAKVTAVVVHPHRAIAATGLADGSLLTHEMQKEKGGAVAGKNPRLTAGVVHRRLRSPHQATVYTLQWASGLYSGPGTALFSMSGDGKLFEAATDGAAGPALNVSTKLMHIKASATAHLAAATSAGRQEAPTPASTFTVVSLPTEAVLPRAVRSAEELHKGTHPPRLVVVGSRTKGGVDVYLFPRPVLRQRGGSDGDAAAGAPLLLHSYGYGDEEVTLAAPAAAGKGKVNSLDTAVLSGAAAGGGDPHPVLCAVGLDTGAVRVLDLTRLLYDPLCGDAAATAAAAAAPQNRSDFLRRLTAESAEAACGRHAAAVRCVRFAPGKGGGGGGGRPDAHAQILASASDDTTVQVWGVSVTAAEGGRQVSLQPLRSVRTHAGRVFSLLWRTEEAGGGVDRHRLFSGSDDLSLSHTCTVEVAAEEAGGEEGGFAPRHRLLTEAAPHTAALEPPTPEGNPECFMRPSRKQAGAAAASPPPAATPAAADDDDVMWQLLEQAGEEAPPPPPDVLALLREKAARWWTTSGGSGGSDGAVVPSSTLSAGLEAAVAAAAAAETTPPASDGGSTAAAAAAFAELAAATESKVRRTSPFATLVESLLGAPASTSTTSEGGLQPLSVVSALLGAQAAALRASDGGDGSGGGAAARREAAELALAGAALSPLIGTGAWQEAMASAAERGGAPVFSALASLSVGDAEEALRTLASHGDARASAVLAHRLLAGEGAGVGDGGVAAPTCWTHRHRGGCSPRPEDETRRVLAPLFAAAAAAAGPPAEAGGGSLVKQVPSLVLRSVAADRLGDAAALLQQVKLEVFATLLDGTLARRRGGGGGGGGDCGLDRARRVAEAASALAEAQTLQVRCGKRGREDGVTAAAASVVDAVNELRDLSAVVQFHAGAAEGGEWEDRLSGNVRTPLDLRRLVTKESCRSGEGGGGGGPPPSKHTLCLAPLREGGGCDGGSAASRSTGCAGEPAGVHPFVLARAGVGFLLAGEGCVVQGAAAEEVPAPPSLSALRAAALAYASVAAAGDGDDTFLAAAVRSFADEASLLHAVGAVHASGTTTMFRRAYLVKAGTLPVDGGSSFPYTLEVSMACGESACVYVGSCTSLSIAGLFAVLLLPAPPSPALAFYASAVVALECMQDAADWAAANDDTARSLSGSVGRAALLCANAAAAEAVADGAVADAHAALLKLAEGGGAEAPRSASALRTACRAAVRAEVRRRGGGGDSCADAAAVASAAVVESGVPQAKRPHVAGHAAA